ncbi:MAG: hypothetical protein WBP81_16715 [Solirubrobacteraceae bacterium]
MSQRLELGREHIALLLGEGELLDSLRDRETVEPGQAVDRVQRVVRLRQCRLDAFHKPIPAPLHDRVSFSDRGRSPFLTDIPVRDLWIGA